MIATLEEHEQALRDELSKSSPREDIVVIETGMYAGIYCWSPFVDSSDGVIIEPDNE